MSYRPQTNPPLPQWLQEHIAQQRQQAQNNPFQLGSANSDQQQNSWGSNNRPDEINSQDYFASTAVGLAPSLSGGLPNTSPITNNFQGLTSIDPNGRAMMGSAPTGMDRFGRAVNGFFTGYDTGNTAGNVGLQAGASLVPGGQLANSAAGAIQGATSNALDFDPMKPAKTSAPGSLSADTPYQRTDGPDFRTGGGLLPTTDNTGSGAGYGATGGTAPFSSSPFLNGTAPPALAGNAPPMNASGGAAPSSQFTGGSGRPVQPYTLPSAPDLQALLANAQRYTDYDASTGRTGYAGAGGGDGYSYLGFDFSQDPGNRDIGKSAKYAFSEFARQAAARGRPMPRTKAEAEAWYRDEIDPYMRQAGYASEWIKGDKVRLNTREGVDEIDFLGNADGDNPALTWQSEVLAGGGAPPTGGFGGQTPVGTGLPAGMDLTSSDLFNDLLRQVRDIAMGNSNGGALTTDTRALIDLLVKGKK